MVKKNIVLGLIAVSTIIVILNGWMLFSNSSDIVYVDANRILQEYNGAKSARETFDKKSQQWKDNIDTLQNEFDQAYRSFEREQGTMSTVAKAEKTIVLKKQQKDLEDYKRATEQNAGNENNKLTQEIILKVNTFLKKYGEEKGYRFILIANQVGTIAYAEEGTDKTAEILEAMNKQK